MDTRTGYDQTYINSEIEEANKMITYYNSKIEKSNNMITLLNELLTMSDDFF